jgi:hypothetical protein
MQGGPPYNHNIVIALTVDQRTVPLVVKHVGVAVPPVIS